MNNITNVFLNNIEEFSKQKVPSKVLKRARESLADYLSVAVAGSRFLNDKINNYINLAEPEKGNCKVIGINKKYALKDTVFLNGLCGHALDFDDGTNSGIIHLGSPIFSALIPLAEKYNCTFNHLLSAVIIGYEVSYTMAISIQPLHKSRGYHATGTCGVLGTAMAIAYLLNFSEEEKKNAFAIACVSATGMLKVLDDESELKPYNVAKTALLGLISAQMAKAGFNGNIDPLGGERGFLKMMTGEENIEIKKPMLNGTYAIQKTYTKPYAACRYCHPSIESAIHIRNAEKINIDDIKDITIHTYSLAVYKHDHTEIPCSASAKMSIPYSVAVGLIFGKAGLKEYEEECVKNSNVIKLCKKIKVLVDDEISKKFPDEQSSIMEIKMNDNKIYNYQVDFPKGEPENPLTEEEFKSRFIDLMTYDEKNREDIENLYSILIKKDIKDVTVNEIIDLI